MKVHKFCADCSFKAAFSENVDNVSSLKTFKFLASNEVRQSKALHVLAGTRLGSGDHLGLWNIAWASWYDVREKLTVLTVHPWAAESYPKQEPLLSQGRPHELKLQSQRSIQWLQEKALFSLTRICFGSCDFITRNANKNWTACSSFSSVPSSGKHTGRRPLSTHKRLVSPLVIDGSVYPSGGLQLASLFKLECTNGLDCTYGLCVMSSNVSFPSQVILFGGSAMPTLLQRS